MTARKTHISPGLCSVTFRKLSCSEVIDLARQAGLSSIEWGTDVHLPADDLDHVRTVAALCREAGIQTPTLGSYLRCDEGDDAQLHATLKAADLIGASRIRVWAGRVGSVEANAAERQRVAKRLSQYCTAARAQGLRIALEFHPNTLTDTVQSAVHLLEAVSDPALYSYWQPTPDLTIDEALSQLSHLKAWLCDLHVFHWTGDRVRHPLGDGASFWSAIFDYIQTEVPQSKDGPRQAFLEFVIDDQPDRLLKDAEVLKSCW
jgi:sugar phosphate isomerase/epimerase